MSILAKIIENKEEEITAKKKKMSIGALMGRADYNVEARDFHGAISRDGLSVIAEVKKASPSRGVIARDLDPGILGVDYEMAGADAISVLTDKDYFSGGLDDLLEVKAVTGIPVLRKDFIIDEYQIYEAKAFGADAVLLITCLHREDTLSRFLGLCREIGIAALVETHSEEDVVKAIAAGADIIGINNRDLKTFAIDVSVTEKLMPFMPPGVLTVSESGIAGREEASRVKMSGVDAVLVGEALVVADDIGHKIAELKMAGLNG